MSAAEQLEPQHIFDVNKYYNGSSGDWSVCGVPMPTEQLTTEARPVCPKCMQLWVPMHERRRSRA